MTARWRFRRESRRSSSASISLRECRRTCRSSTRSSTRSASTTSRPATSFRRSETSSRSWQSTRTVLKAYRELETKGLAVGRPGQGTFIVATLGQVALPELAALRRSLVSWVTAADSAGLDQDGIAALVANVLRDFRERRGGTADRRGAAQHEEEGVA